MTVEHWAVALAGSPWVFVAMYAFATIDGFFPPVPSESLVIALAALAGSSGDPNIVLLVLVAAAGAFTGDQLAYLIGTRVHVRSLRVMRSRRAQASLDWAEGALERRGASFIIAARYIPVGRVAVNMTAGALGFRRRRFVALTAIAAVLWAVYSALIGLSAGALLKDNPAIAVAVGVVGGILLGLLVDRVLRTWTARRGGTSEPATDAADDGPVTDGSRSVPPG
ncbi:DedA family protein [Cellulomonas edaphi]|uniref:DedA family protein n=1 Tax=Cellulomonas edaphi TaxID=3053468 RepID=A0ABT7S919_9CELL|nr:DedA family protein [Cellulomons edaphi]MDM7832124.1 DedA family protein [Cellulomons edaphi]